MATTSDKQTTGCFSLALRVWVFLFLASLATAIVFTAIPQDLSEVDGRLSESARENSKPRDLDAVIRASLRMGHPIKLSESEINRWLAATLRPKQNGLLAKRISLDAVYVKLDDALAEIIIERSVMGRPFTTSMFIQIEQTQASSGAQTMIHRHGGRYHEAIPMPLRGGRIGRLIVPQGFVSLTIPAFTQLAEAYQEEIDLAMKSMSVIRIEQDALILEPQPSESEAEAEFQAF
ncbi:MAG: hypothetical protein ACO3RV_01580 [Luteolibacter sp.]